MVIRLFKDHSLTNDINNKKIKLKVDKLKLFYREKERKAMGKVDVICEWSLRRTKGCMVG